MSGKPDNVVAHPLVLELFRVLPAPGEEMPLDKRVAWIETAAAIFNLLYGKGGDIEITFSAEDRD